MKLAIIRGTQQILRDIGKPGFGEVPVKEFTEFLGVAGEDIEELLEGIRIELASRVLDADFMLVLESNTLKVERKVARRGVIRLHGGVEPVGLTLIEREKIMEQIITEIPEELKKDELGKQKIVEALGKRSKNDVSAIVSGALFLSCKEKNLTFWKAVMQRMKDMHDDDRWGDRIREAKLLRHQVETMVRNIPVPAIRLEIQSGQMLGRGILPSIAKDILEEKKRTANLSS